MKKIFGALMILGLIACGTEQKNEEPKKEEKAVSNKEELQVEIIKMEEELTKKMRTQFDENLAKRVVEFYKSYADNNPQDSISADYLFKAGEVSIGLKEYEQAAGFFERIYNHFPNYAKRVESLYLVGFVYDEHLSNYGKAQTYYQKVINEHPDHGFADDAKASIETLGLTDEEIIKKFQEAQKAVQ